MEPVSKPSTGLTAWLAANRNQGGLILMIAGIVLAALPSGSPLSTGRNFCGVEIITGLVAALLLFAGVGLRFRPEGAGSPTDEARLTVLGLGGLIGLCIAVLGILLNIQWWDFLTRWLRFGERDGAWKVLLALVTLVAASPSCSSAWRASAPRSDRAPFCAGSSTGTTRCSAASCCS